MADKTSEVVRLTGRMFYFYTDDPDGCQDGDIVIQPNLDAAGAAAARFRRTNLGYSGYWVGYLFQDKGRRRIVNWRTLFPNWENNYSFSRTQQDAADRVQEIVQNLAGCRAIRVKGGWSIEQDATG